MKYLHGLISIHAPRTGSDDLQSSRLLADRISIHAPRTGSDVDVANVPNQEEPFQSTLPARGATPPTPAATPPAIDFNPRSPHGERLHELAI